MSSTTTLRPTASPAYQPRSFRHASPFPAASSSSSTVTAAAAAAAATSGRSSNPLTYPLPSRPVSPMPPIQAPRPGVDRLSAVPPPSAAAAAAGADHHLSTSTHPDRRGSSLRNEVKATDSSRRRHRLASVENRNGDKEVEEGEVKEVTRAMKQSAKDVLKLLSSLPRPLPESLPPTFLPTPRSTPSPPPNESFASFARAMSTSSPRSSSSRSSSLGKRRRSSSPGGSGGPLVGLGLSGAESSLSSKKARIQGGVAMTPTTSTFGFAGKTVSPEMRRPLSGGKTPIVVEGKETWSKAKWASAAGGYKTRAILLKRHGDAHLRLAGAKPQFLHLPADPLLGLLSLTDAVLLWLYAYWCDEQAEGRVKMTPYRESQALRDFVKTEWEKWVRRGWSEYAGVEEEEREGLRDMGRGMIGLMYLIEAVVYYHLSAEQLHHLNRRSTQINALASSSSSSAAMTSSNSVPVTTGPTSQPTLPNHTSPTASADESPSNPSIGPSPHSATSSSTHHPIEIPSEIMGLISTSTSQSSRASTNLLNSRHHLPLSLLRTKFPTTYDTAIHSELADEALPPPNDPLGAARKVDIDALDRFVWPIELGMCAPMAHLAIFGRGLVRELAETAGKEWETCLEAPGA